MKEFGENCAEFSEAEHLTKVQADKQAAPVLFTRSPTDTCVLPGTEREWEDALHVLSKPKSGRAFGPDAIPSELIAAGQGYRRALGVLCAKVSKQGAPMLWKGGDMAAVPRQPGPLTPSNTRGVLCHSCPGKMYAPMSAGMSQTGAVQGGGTECAIMTRSLFSSWAQLRKLSSAVIFVDIRKAFYSVLVEEVVGPVMGRSDRAKVMARLGWTESERHRFEATLQGRQHETALLGMALDVAAMLADWHQTNWFTVQGAEKRAIHLTGVRPGDPTADVMFAFVFARFHRKLVDRLVKKGLLPAILLHGGQLDASADESEEIHIEPPAYMDDFFLPVVSDTAAGLLPRVALATQVAIETAREHGLQLNMASNKTEAVVDFRGKGRQQVLEGLALEFPGRSVDPNRQGRGWRLAKVGQHVSALGNRGLSWSEARSGARGSSFCRKGGVPGHAQEDPESEASLQDGQGGGRPRGCQLPFALWVWYLAFPQRFGH